MRANCDLEISSNNGVTAVRPAENGRLSRLVRKTQDGTQEVWVFCDATTWTDGDGDERIHHHKRGLTCGNSHDFTKFMCLCRHDFNLVIQSAGFFVPLSNGERDVGQSHDDKPLADYSDAEQKIVRLDLPDREILERILL